MTEQVIWGLVVATEVTFNDYLADYAADFHEWIEGTVIKMSPVQDDHVRVAQYLYVLFKGYFDFNPIGRVMSAPFVMRLANSSREPDLQIILNDNPGEYTKTFMNGPADICIEVVSPESVQRDYGEKFAEYEKGGVKEYWILDWLRKDVRFHRLNEDGVYIRYSEDEQGNYMTPALPNFVLHIPTLWRDSEPGLAEILETLKKMFQSHE